MTRLGEIEVWVDGEKALSEQAYLAERAHAEHRAGQAKGAEMMAHFIRCGELLMEAKKQAGSGKWLAWLGENFEGSARQGAGAPGCDTRVAPHLARLPARDSASQGDRWAAGAPGEVPARDARDRRARGRPRRCLCAAYAGQLHLRLRGGPRAPAWRRGALAGPESDGGRGLGASAEGGLGCADPLWPLSLAYELGPGDEDLLRRWAGSTHEVRLAHADLKASASLFDDEGNYRPPTRELSWDGSILLLPTGHVEARLVGDEVWRWGEWDWTVAKEVRNHADPNIFYRYDLIEDLLGSVLPTGEKGDDWGDAREAEEALARTLGRLGARLAKPPPDLQDPRVVYQIGEEMLGDWQTDTSDWRRFAAYVRSL
jgi:hypothetical protein